MPDALDKLSEIFLETGLLRPIGQARPAGRAQRETPAEETEKECQEPESVEIPLSS
jgi:hypothetical protein